MIMPKKRCCLMKAHASGGRSRHSQLIFQSSSMAQSSSTGPLRKAPSSDVSIAGLVLSSFDQSGLPVNRSPSSQTSPASSASRSVSDIAGIAFFAHAKIGRVRTSRRQVDLDVDLELLGAGEDGLIKSSLMKPGFVRSPTAEATRSRNGIFKS